MTAELYRGRSKTSSFQFEGEIVSGFNAGNRIGTGKRACIEWSGHLTGGRPFGSYPSAWWLAPGVGDRLVLFRCRFQDVGGKKSGTVAGSTPGIFLFGSGGTGVRL